MTQLPSWWPASSSSSMATGDGAHLMGGNPSRRPHHKYMEAWILKSIGTKRRLSNRRSRLFCVIFLSARSWLFDCFCCWKRWVWYYNWHWHLPIHTNLIMYLFILPLRCHSRPLRLAPIGGMRWRDAREGGDSPPQNSGDYLPFRIRPSSWGLCPSPLAMLM